MKVNSKEDLEEIFKEAANQKMMAGVELTIPGQKDTEFIINETKSIANKLKYYLKAYDENLRLKACQEIKIINAYAIKKIEMI